MARYMPVASAAKRPCRRWPVRPPSVTMHHSAEGSPTTASATRARRAVSASRAFPPQVSSQNAPVTGLDYFGARYFSGAQGRFTSPDEPLIDQFPEDPQSWNLYSHVRNNPLIFTDEA
ncbi:MAG: RHS repeat-associated core domain-containing protein [Bryobacteraceae bacterium]